MGSLYREVKSDMVNLEITSRNDSDTRTLGRRLGELAEPGDVFLLEGNLGAGKTTLVQGIAEGLGVEGYASSPTFTLVNEYTGRIPLYHIDLYRLTDAREALDLGLDEYLYGNGITAIEWAEKAMEAMPDETLLIIIRYLDDSQRAIRLQANGTRYEALVSTLVKERAQ